MANPDRLTGLDASFLRSRRAAPTCTWAPCCLRGPGAGLRRVRRSARARPAPRAALPPAARVPAAGRRAAGLGRRPALQRPLPRAPHGAARRPRASERAARARRAGVRPAARPREAAVGDLARRHDGRRPLRADLQDPPRARGRDLGRGHHDRAVRPRAGPGAAAASRAGLVAAAAPERGELLADGSPSGPRRRSKSLRRRARRIPTRGRREAATPSPGWPRCSPRAAGRAAAAR